MATREATPENIHLALEKLTEDDLTPMPDSLSPGLANFEMFELTTSIRRGYWKMREGTMFNASRIDVPTDVAVRSVGKLMFRHRHPLEKQSVHHLTFDMPADTTAKDVVAVGIGHYLNRTYDGVAGAEIAQLIADARFVAESAESAELSSQTS